ncbi:MAG TPA: LysM domain-containing protein [Chthoniobacteraceae bacterium]|nr:LysM domain-containing protein [Chthoniobacteraceae bacterium]
MKTVCLLLAAFAATAGALAQERFAPERLPEARPSADEVRALRQLVEKQSREIDELRLAIEELTKAVQLKEGARLPASLPGTHPAAPAPASAPEPPPAPAPVAPPPEPRVERAEPAGVPHTVAKGETLTSIAKHYNVSIADLHKANKVVDERKLQIGQVLQIPIKPADTTTDKKENP